MERGKWNMNKKKETGNRKQQKRKGQIDMGGKGSKQKVDTSRGSIHHSNDMESTDVLMCALG